MSQILVTGGLDKINPNGNVQYNWLLDFPFVGKSSDNAIELKVLECDFPGFYYHTKRTIAAVKEAAVTPNQMLRAVA